MWRRMLWAPVAWVASRPRVVDWLIRRAARTPYYPITARHDPTDIYMDRHWLFNPRDKDCNGDESAPRWKWLPSVRVHHIMRADDDGAMHDHPWNARTIVLRGWYSEERPWPHRWHADSRTVYRRPAGYTGRVLFNSYHRIREVSPGGVFTLWFVWGRQGEWGFLVNGRKVPWREYLNE